MKVTHDNYKEVQVKYNIDLEAIFIELQKAKLEIKLLRKDLTSLEAKYTREGIKKEDIPQPKIHESYR